MKRILAMTLSLYFVSFVFAEKRAFTIADLYKLKTIESPVISPDGRH